MARYLVNTKKDHRGLHEVHLADNPGCRYLPDVVNQHELPGDHSTCHTAVATANLTHSPADGCKHCAPACHKG